MRMRAPEDSSSGCTIEGGKTYEPDDDGYVEVDNADHAAVLRQHGYTDEPDNREAEPTGRRKTSGTKPSEGKPDTDFAAMNKDDLIEWLEENDVDVEGRPKKDELIAMCEKRERELRQ